MPVFPQNSIKFVADVYGVGKSILCDKLSNLLDNPSYSACELISKLNGEEYGKNKAIADKNANQNFLVGAVQRKLIKDPQFILAGHFCIFTAENLVDILPENVFSQLGISKIILLESDPLIVLQNIQKRDHKCYSYEEISRLIEAEKMQAKKGVSFLEYPIDFSSNDI